MRWIPRFLRRQRLSARYRHTDTALNLEQTAVDQRFVMPYRKTFDFQHEFLNNEHASFATCPTRQGMIEIGIDGWLLPADALKLYELVYCCGGDCLELGTYRGLSASVMLRASVAAGVRNKILSIDLDPGSTQAGERNLAASPGCKRVLFFNDDGDHALRKFAQANRQFAFCFVDHSHRYEHVRTACQALPSIMLPGAFCLFHDYNDPRNADSACDDYGVWQGVADGLDGRCFEFWGIFGCCGLFRRI
jgi:hypothetical protein